MFGMLLNTVQRLEPLKFFLIVASVFGLSFLLITPPFQGADEIVHFYRAYQVSEGNFISDQLGNKVGGELPKSLGKVIAETNDPVIASYPQNKYDIRETKSALRIKTDARNEMFYDFRGAAAYSPVVYLSAASGITVSRALHLPPLVSLYAARLGNLIAWIVLLGAAIVCMPRRKWALVSIGLLPMALFQASTLNGDAITNGSLVLLIALVLNYRKGTEVLGRNQIGLLLLTASIMVLSKPVMFVFLPLVLLLHKRKFVSAAHSYVIKSSLIIIPLILFIGWSLAINGIDTVSAYANKQDPSAQLRFILHNPHSYINVLWNTYFYTWGDSITRSFIGVFGWADAPLSELIVAIGYIGLVALLIATVKGEKITWLDKREKLFLLGLGFIYWLAVSTSLYIYYSPVGFKIIYGLQGRYYLPLAILAIPLLMSKSVRVSKEWYRNLAVGLPLFLLITSTITIYVRYFINNV